MHWPPLLAGLLADAPPAIRPVAPATRACVCAECGLAGGDGDDFRWLPAARAGRHGSGLPAAAAPAAVVCRICVLSWTAAWEPERVRLALIPELAQGPLNALVTLLTVNLLRQRAGEPVPAGIAAVLQANWLDALQQRARATHVELPYTVSAALLRQTLRALPAGGREPVLGELAGLRYLPEPADPELAGFFNRRRLLPAGHAGSRARA